MEVGIETLVPKNKVIPSSLKVTSDRNQAIVTVRFLRYWILFLGFIGILSALVFWFIQEGVDFSILMFLFLFIGLPAFFIGAFYAFPNQRLIADKQQSSLFIQNRWLFFPLKTIRVLQDDCASVKMAMIGKAAEVRDGISVGSSFAGVAMLATVGLGWVQFRMEQVTVPVFGIMITRKNGEEILTHIAWGKDSCGKAVEAIWSVFPNLKPE